MGGWASNYRPLSFVNKQRALRPFDGAFELDPRSIYPRIGIAGVLAINLMN
jgi:hypothetical protein